MAGSDWLAYAFVLFILVKSFSHFSAVEKKIETEQRDFGFQPWKILSVLLLPWAIRKAEKDYASEQKNDR